MTDRITHDLNQGYSWGLEYANIHGWRQERGTWCVWNRHTGEIVAEFPPERNQHGYDLAENKARIASIPEGYNDEFVDYDGVA